MAAGDTRVLYGPNAISLSEYVKKHPQYADPLLANNRFILEKSATQSETFALPALSSGSNAVVMVITCDSASKYDLKLIRGATTVDHTWGDSCGRGNLSLYTTAPIAGSHDGLSVKATVADGTSYRVAVLETTSTTK